MAENKRRLRFPKKLFFLALILALILILIYGLGGGGLSGFLTKIIPSSDSSSSKKNDDANVRIVSLKLHGDNIYLEGVEYTHLSEIKKAIDKIRDQDPSRKIIVEFHRKGEDPVIPSKRIEKFFNDYGIEYIIKGTEEE